MRLGGIFILLFLLFNNAYGNCRHLAKQFIEHREVDIYWYSGRGYSSDYLEMEYRSLTLGSIAYEFIKDDHIYIDLVRTNANFRRLGISKMLHKTLISKHNPRKFSFRLGDTNKAQFLHGVREGMFGGGVADDLEQNRIVEKYLIQEYASVSDRVIYGAARYTPAYKTLTKLGYKLAMVDLDVTYGHTRYLVIKMEFVKNE